MIPDEIKKLNQWVCVRNGSKVPMRATENSAASSSDPATWSSYIEAESAVRAGHYDQVGFVFNSNGVVGIDIDCGFDSDGLMTALAVDIIGACESYTEISRSHRGFHILVKGTLPFDGKNNRNGVEIYQSKRYFILTGNDCIYPPEIKENQQAIDYIIEKYFAEELKTGSKGSVITPRVYNPQWELPSEGRVRIRPIYPKITPGSRNLCLTSLAGMLHTLGYTKSQIYNELQYANKTACTPPLNLRELRQITNSVTRYKR